mgnify:FL=1
MHNRNSYTRINSFIFAILLLVVNGCSTNNPDWSDVNSNNSNNSSYMVRYRVNYDLPYPSKSNIVISLATKNGGTQYVEPQGRNSVYYYGPYTKGQLLSVSFSATVPAPKLKTAVSLDGESYVCVAHNSAESNSGTTNISVSTSYRIQ